MLRRQNFQIKINTRAHTHTHITHIKINYLFIVYLAFTVLHALIRYIIYRIWWVIQNLYINCKLPNISCEVIAITKWALPGWRAGKQTLSTDQHASSPFLLFFFCAIGQSYKIRYRYSPDGLEAHRSLIKRELLFATRWQLPLLSHRCVSAVDSGTNSAVSITRY